jgi:hypothetical protein
MIFEMAIMESCSADEIQEFLQDAKAVNEAIRQEIVTEKTIVRLDKVAKLSKATKMAEFEIAKKKNDRDFRKLLTVWEMEKKLEDILHKRYGQQAQSLGRKNMADSVRRKNSAGMSNVVKKATAGIKKQFNPEVKTKGTKTPQKPVSTSSVAMATSNAW